MPKKNTGLEYEKMAQIVFQQIVNSDLKVFQNIEVKHDIDIKGKTAMHQIDVYWEFEMGGIIYRNIVQAKDWKSKVPLKEMLEEADIVALHCPLTEQSRHLINEETIGYMKKSAILINAARGPVVDSDALANALNEGRIAGAGIDVFEVEPPLHTDHPLLHAKNTIVTPHVAFATKESMEIRAEIVFRNIDQWLKGEQINKIL